VIHNCIIWIFLNHAKKELDEITPLRKAQLDKLGQIISQYLHNQNRCDIIVICTHNSRRSQLGEILIRTAATCYGIKNLTVYSGGIEETAFNYRMVEALSRAGFEFQKSGKEHNLIRQFKMVGRHIGQKMFSKKYDDPFNPQKDFIAIIVCEHADKNCPIVIGAKKRVSLPYNDPRE